MFKLKLLQNSRLAKGLTGAIVALILCITVSSTPATAMPLNQILNTFFRFVTGVDLTTYIQDIFGELTSYLPTEIASLLNSEAGDVAIDALDARSEAKDLVVNSQFSFDQFGGDVALTAESIAKETDNAVISTWANSHLSDQGQARIQEEIESVGQTISTVMSTSEAAQSKDVTQDIMKDLVSIQAQQTQLFGRMRVEQMQARLDTQYSNLALVNVVRSIEEQNRREQFEARAAGGVLLNYSGQF